METVRQSFLLNKLMLTEKLVLLVGPTGTGKTSTVKSFLSRLAKDTFVANSMSFSARTSSLQVQTALMDKLVRLDNNKCNNKMQFYFCFNFIFALVCRLRKGVYGPSLNRKAILFIDDINMSGKEKYGAQPAVEFVRNFIDHGFCYDP